MGYPWPQTFCASAHESVKEAPEFRMASQDDRRLRHRMPGVFLPEISSIDRNARRSSGSSSTSKTFAVLIGTLPVSSAADFTEFPHRVAAPGRGNRVSRTKIPKMYGLAARKII